jgi:hypothetical protein
VEYYAAIKNETMAGGVAQGVEHLLRKYEALVPTPVPPKNKKKGK